MDNSKITSFEAISLVSLLALTPMLLSASQNLSKEFGNAAVLQFLYRAILLFVFLFIVLNLYKPFDGKNILDVSEFLGGKILKFITGFFISIYLISISIFTLQEFGQDIQNIMFNYTSVGEINILFVIAMTFGAYYGLKGILRSGTVILPMVIGGIILLFVSLHSKIELTNLTPVFGTGYKDVFLNGILRIGSFNSFLILFIIGNRIENLKRTTYKSAFIAIALSFILLFLLFTVFSNVELLENSFAVFELTRMVSFGRFFQRCESIFAVIWITVACFFLSTTLYISMDMLKNIFDLKYSNRILPCLSLLIFVCSLLIPNHTFSVKARQILYSYASPIIFFAYTFLLLLLAKIKASGGKNEITQ